MSSLQTCRVAICFQLAHLAHQLSDLRRERRIGKIFPSASASPQGARTDRWQQWRFGIFVLQILGDDRRVVNGYVLINQNRHASEWIETQKIRLALFALREINLDQLIREAF